jgi:hypothetical protein
MDTSIVPLVLVALVAGMVGTWHELRASLEPAACTECPHCRDRKAAQLAAEQEHVRRQAELRSWYARRNGLDDEDERRP